ncbi:MAG: glycosyltransferase family 2 protein [Planctomycetaceae bacterium]|nr:glycosyltransferase family 2 protein [Planctomycetaceae bacterium]
MSPTVSVVMSAYNSSAHIRQSVQSVLDQTFRDFEFVIVNDGSMDDTPTILDEFASRDERVRIIHQENTGLTQALVTGCAQARGEFIARQDDDDWSHPKRFARQLGFLETHPTVGFLGCATRYVGPQGEPLELVTRSADPVIASRELAEKRFGPPAHGGVMFRRDIYEKAGGYRPEFYLGQDSDLWLRMIEVAQFACIPEESYYFRRHAASVSSRHRDMQHTFGLLSHACRVARSENRSEQEFLDEAKRVARLVRSARASGNQHGEDLELNYLIGSRLVKTGSIEARRYLWPVVLNRPWHWRAWTRIVQSYLTGRRQAAEESVRE